MVLDYLRHYTFGIPVIDDDHESILVFMESVKSLCLEGRTQEAAKVLEKLISFLPRHLQLEEDVMDEIDFPYAQNHKEIHARLTCELKDLRVGFFGYNSDQILDALERIIKGHIDQYDRQYVEFYADWLKAREEKKGNK